MQLIISADDNLDDVLVQLGHLFGRELQIASSRGLGTIASSQDRRAPSSRAASGARAASKRTPAAKGRSGTTRATKRGAATAKRTGTARGKSSVSTGKSAASAALDTSPVRAWARANGHAVNARGRLPAAVLKAYVAAHN